ncbi:MAG: FAD-dependent oxidoreductase [Canibacter sp.]
MNDAALAVIGCGTIGSMAFWQASKKTDSVVAFEAETPGHAESAVGGDSRLFRVSSRGTTEYHSMLQNARKGWLSLEEESGKSIFNKCGGLYLGDPDGDYLPDLLRSIRRGGIEHEQLSKSEIQERFPQHRLEDGEAGIFEPSAGFLKTHEAVAAAVDVAESNGARVQTHAPIDAIEETRNGVKLISGNNSWTADKVLIAAGAGSQHLLPESIRTETHIRRIFLTWFLMNTSSPEHFRPDQFPIFVHILGKMSMYGAPSIDDYMVKATLDDRSKPVDEVRGAMHTLSQAEKLETEETIRQFLPGLNPSIARIGVYSDLYSSDNRAFVGRLPGTERQFIATGFSGIGFKMASEAGRAIAEQIFGDDDAVPTYWSPSRVS